MSAQYEVKLEEKKTIISIYQAGEQKPKMIISKTIFFDLIKNKEIFKGNLISAEEARNNIIEQ